MASIAIIGLGPVGLATALSFAARGDVVVGVDADVDRQNQIAKGSVPFYEAGAADALREALASKTFRVAPDMASAVGASDLIFLCVGTPSGADGAMDDSFLRQATKEIVEAWSDQRRRTVVVKSTVVPGTTERVIRPILDAARKPFGLAVNPEFLREGHALEDALRPDRIIIGADDPASRKALRSLYADAQCPVLETTVRTAEAIKYATNAFLATKVAFANELANVCAALGVSYDEVLRGVALDPRINPRFLVPGVGFGGSCFPKDVRALVAAAKQAGETPLLLEAVLAQNEMQYRRAIELLEEELGDLMGKRIALLGVAFKGNTDDVRETRAVPIARSLLSKGAIVIAYDPFAGPAFARLVPDVKIVGSAEEALAGADGAIFQADWPAFSRFTAKDFLTLMATPVVVDGRRILDPDRMQGVRFRRIG